MTINLNEYVFNSEVTEWKVKVIDCTFTGIRVLYAWDQEPDEPRLFPTFGLEEYLRDLDGDGITFNYRKYKHSEYWSIEDIVLDMELPERLSFLLGDYLRSAYQEKTRELKK